MEYGQPFEAEKGNKIVFPQEPLKRNTTLLTP